MRLTTVQRRRPIPPPIRRLGRHPLEPIAQRPSLTSSWAAARRTDTPPATISDTTITWPLLSFAIPRSASSRGTRRVQPQAAPAKTRCVSSGDRQRASLGDSLHLFVLVKNRLQFAAMRLELTAACFPGSCARTRGSAPAWGVTADICDALDSAARARGASTLFVLNPPPRRLTDRFPRTTCEGFA
jgi:hypothetical protein